LSQEITQKLPASISLLSDIVMISPRYEQANLKPWKSASSL